MRNWEDVLPPEIARKQAIWERNWQMYRLRSAGVSCSEIAKRFNLSRYRVDEITNNLWRDKRHKTPPIQLYFNGDGLSTPRKKRLALHLECTDFVEDLS